MPRRFQFSLKAMLVAIVLVAAPCAWVSSNAVLVRQRYNIIRSDENGVWQINRIRSPADPVELPWIRRALGDEPVMKIRCEPPHSAKSSFQIGEVDEATVLRVRRVFPEATIYLPGGKEWRRGSPQIGDYREERLQELITGRHRHG